MSIALIATPLLIGTINLFRSTPADATFSAPCSERGSWVKGELNIYWFDVEQGDSQLIVGPTGKTMLIDLGETDWYPTGADTKTDLVAGKIQSICGVGGRVHLDYVLASHHHLDHTGFAGNPNDVAPVGNGIYRLLSPGGKNFTVGTLLDRDGGVWRDSNNDGDCDPGSAAFPTDEIKWHNAGTVSPTAVRWICWLYGPDAQPDRKNIAGKVVTLVNSAPWPAIDLGPGVEARIVQANAKGIKMPDGVTPVEGDHTRDAIPTAENDYTVAVKLSLGSFDYATAGDANGEFATGERPDFVYSDLEASLIEDFGDVETMRANHHGSSHSSSNAYISGLAPETAFISCGDNSYGHPGNRVLDAFRRVEADIYLSNNPCAVRDADGSPIDYSGTLNNGGTVHLATTGGGSAYSVHYDAGSRSYLAHDESNAGEPGPVINEYRFGPDQWVELYNPGSSPAVLDDLWIDDRAAGGAEPVRIPGPAEIAPGGRHLVALPKGFLAGEGTDSIRLLTGAGGREVVLDGHLYTLNRALSAGGIHRMGDGGSWCATPTDSSTPGSENPTSCR